MPKVAPLRVADLDEQPIHRQALLQRLDGEFADRGARLFLRSREGSASSVPCASSINVEPIADVEEVDRHLRTGARALADARC